MTACSGVLLCQRRRASRFVLIGVAALFLAGAGCSGGYQSQPPPPAISVAVTPPSASVATGQTQSLTPTVSNDSQNKGVTWSLSGAGCTGPSCGMLSATSSLSGTAITYTAPSTVPNPATVIVTATSIADSTKSSSASITITLAPAISVWRPWRRLR